ncbi:MAG TPA: alpha-amylase family glycosyl hydrolase [Geobacteraceae bacterium]|nr:alpha-amylase family glycosyl hydrolase [Geobacteraceae bacterium]
MYRTDNRQAYFPYAVQIRHKAWKRLLLADLHADIRDSGKPRIMFFRGVAARLSAEGRSVTAGELNLYALQLTIQRYIINDYLERQCPEILPLLLAETGITPGSAGLAGLAGTFCRLFPGGPFLDHPELDPAAWINAPGISLERARQLTGEILLLAVAAENRAVDGFRDILDWKELLLTSECFTVVEEMEERLAVAPPVAGLGFTLPEVLRLPLKAAPTSLYEQLRYMKEQWRAAIPEELLPEMLAAFAVMEEEGRIFAPRGEPGGAPVLEFAGGGGYPGSNDYYPEPERFSPDTHWMPNVVLLAKMVYVWLGQLSVRYGEEIHRLDRIPDAELDRLARWGVTGLWLIGLWERSPASRTIKQLCGNPEAISSAYSLFDYTIAADLGGEEALLNLRDRALRRGIRLASDMVPNHTGLFSRWTVEHPDWFVQLEYPPYPAYSFTGPDLSSSREISLHIEDGYWERRDAAVVFKHYDHRNGRTRYIYHGNDGSSTPWNDTAQLDYLNPEVRETVMNTILHVARLFPIIRFDAAMTLAKKHYQRLWFPQPGHGGIPSRGERGMTREQFDEAMPEEFWRQVVDRVAAEAPDTLLLAEAFWLMEGYFVRTLGMHRVYNSAFMNMLKMEENAKYRQTVKNVLEFNPQVLQRFVNFMNNPDEKTAVEQFGKESKYFGACVLLVTMPGLPMLGHGQVEGFHEQYGMEYKKAYWNEAEDEHLVREHERRIFPLMRRRWLFSGADNFVFYDFNVGSHVNEDVFAYSNRCGDQRAIILYHNRFADTAGWINSSTSFAVKGEGEMVELHRTTLGDALGFKGDGRHYYVFLDYLEGGEYIRNGRELREKGLFVELEAYGCHAYLDFREIWDDDYGTYGKLCHQLQGRGVPSVEDEIIQIRHAGLIEEYRLHLEHHGALLTGICDDVSAGAIAEETEKFAADQEKLLEDIARAAELTGTGAQLMAQILAGLKLLEEMAGDASSLLGSRTARLLAFAWLTLHRLGDLDDASSGEAGAAELVARFGLARPLEEELYGEVTDDEDRLAGLDVPVVMALFRLLLRHQEFLLRYGDTPRQSLTELLADRDVSAFIGRHWSGCHEWFIKERWEILVQWLRLTAMVLAATAVVREGEEPPAADLAVECEQLLAEAETAAYRIDLLLAGGGA